MRLEHLGLIGNCQYSALVARTGEIPWCCLPRFDSEPVFGALLDEQSGGSFLVGPAAGGDGTQRYLPNTPILETTFRTAEGAFRIIDFAPRFFQHDRCFRPTQIVRIVEPIDGQPRIRVRCAPRLGWSRGLPVEVSGSNHVRYDGFAGPLRLWTDIPLSSLGGAPIALTGRRHLILSWGANIDEPLTGLCERFRAETTRYWQRWVKHCNVPPLYQAEVIRSALTLKLHCFEDTGAIVAATTTSIPESPHSGRTWDYRYCWLRDSYYVLGAFRLLGQFEEREHFTQYLLNVVASHPSLDLAPLHRVDGTSDLEERVLPDWPGYHGDGPVRIGNAAAAQRQHDIFGELVLALAPVFLDDRFHAEQTRESLDLLVRLTQKAIDVAGTPDAGIWEVRAAMKPQTFSSLMSWAACDRMAMVADRHLPGRGDGYRAAAARIKAEILDRAWHAGLGSFVSSYGGSDFDASLLQLGPLHFLPPSDGRLATSLDATTRALGRGGWLLRYHNDDGLGLPTIAFTMCTFWLVEALAAIGRLDEARQVLEHARAALSPLGLLSEDYEATSLQMWGNFPQAYSHVGLIHAAFAASPHWSDIL